MEDSRQAIDDSRNLLDSDSDDADETLFDYQSQDDKQIAKQLVLLITWGTMGLMYAIPGPNLLDIACKMGISIGRLGLIFVGRSVGSLAGRLLSNGFARLRKGYGVMVLYLMVFMLFQGVFPLAGNLQAAVCIMMALGGTYGLLYEGCRAIDISNGMYRGGDLNKRSFALSIGAAIAPVISSPFMTSVTHARPTGNLTGQKSIAFTNNKHYESNVTTIFPGTLCPIDSDFGKSFWLTIIPCIIVLLILFCFMFQNSANSMRNDFEHGIGSDIKDWRVYACHALLFTVLLLYRGFYRIAELVLFCYIILGPFEINNTKASLFLMVLWIAFAFGHILQQIVTLKVVGSERQFGVVIFKACVCLIMAIVLLNINNTNALTMGLFVYMLFISELGPFGQEILLKQGTVSEQRAGKLAIFADALAEALFPAVSLVLMYTKGWRALTFVILTISLLQLLASSALALCQFALKRGRLSQNYENLSLNKQDDGNRRRIRKEISKLLGGYTDHEVSYATSDEEVVFDKRRQKTFGLLPDMRQL